MPSLWRHKPRTQPNLQQTHRYNRRRRHSSIGHVTPVDFEMQYSSQDAEIQLAA